MKRFCVFFGLVVCFMCGCENEVTGSVTLNKENSRVVSVRVQIGGSEFFLKSPDQVDKMEKTLRSMLVDIQYAKEQMEVKEQKRQ